MDTRSTLLPVEEQLSNGTGKSVVFICGADMSQYVQNQKKRHQWRFQDNNRRVTFQVTIVDADLDKVVFHGKISPVYLWALVCPRTGLHLHKRRKVPAAMQPDDDTRDTHSCRSAAKYSIIGSRSA